MKRLWHRFKSLFVTKEKKMEISDETKQKLCKGAIQHGVCPHDCDRCAWNTLK